MSHKLLEMCSPTWLIINGQMVGFHQHPCMSQPMIIEFDTDLYSNDYTLPLLDYPLWWVACTYDLFMYTGDTDFVVTYYQTMINVLDEFYPSITDNTTQLITKGIGISGGYGDYAFLGRTGPVTYFNALYVIALDNAASMATYLGHKQDAARWSARSKAVADAINSYNFDSSVGAFFDGTCGDTYCATHAQDGNIRS
jgi:glycogen debranching enzyme